MIQFEYEFNKGEYQSGDHLGIYPVNSEEHVAFLKQRLTKNPPEDKPLQMIYRDAKYIIRDVDFPNYRTYDQILRHIVDLSQVPNQELLKVLAHFSTDHEEKEALTILADDWESYKTWKTNEVMGICETLEKFPSVKITSANLISRLKIIKPRLYSIASTPAHKKGDVALVVGKVEYKTLAGEPRMGLATRHLEKCPIETPFMGFFRTSKFRLPEDSTKPVMMIAAGSGIAPFRGFWMRRNELIKMGKNVGKTLLYFGCRKRSMDLLKDETDALTKDGMEFERISAYSREVAMQKQYVQDAVAKDGDKIYNLWIKEGGFLYVCGKNSMAQALEEVLATIFQTNGKFNKEEALAEVDKLKKAKRYQEDIFTG